MLLLDLHLRLLAVTCHGFAFTSIDVVRRAFFIGLFGTAFDTLDRIAE